MGLGEEGTHGGGGLVARGLVIRHIKERWDNTRARAARIAKARRRGREGVISVRGRNIAISTWRRLGAGERCVRHRSIRIRSVSRNLARARAIYSISFWQLFDGCKRQKKRAARQR